MTDKVLFPEWLNPLSMATKTTIKVLPAAGSKVTLRKIQWKN